MLDVLSRIKDEIQGEVDKSGFTLHDHASDASVFEVMPMAVVYPKNTADIVATVRAVADVAKTIPKEHRDESPLSISVRAGGTCMSGGSLNTGIILNMTRHMSRIEIDKEAQTATVEMGAMFRDIERAADAQGLMFAPYTSSKDTCGIGGMLGNNASGEKSVRFGATIDNVLELEVVLRDGTIIQTAPKPLTAVEDFIEKSVLDLYQTYGQRLKKAVGNVPKAASGYRLERVFDLASEIFDLTPLFIGAQGTLGIITRAKLKLVPKPAYTRLVLIPVGTLADLPFILKTIMGHNPEGVETFDVNTFDRAVHFLLQETTLIRKYFYNGVSPKPASTLIVLAQFSEETQEETDAVAKRCAEELQSSHSVTADVVTDQSIADAAWHIRRVSFKVMRENNIGSYHAVPCIEDIIVPIDKFDVFVPRLIAILKKYNLFYGFHGHIGDGALRVIPVFDLARLDVVDTIAAFMREVFALIKDVGGNTSADHSDGIIRTPFLQEFYGEQLYAAFEQIKQTFDPYAMFNPHKKVGGTIEHIKKYIKKG